jgi:hypothetical protein
MDFSTLMTGDVSLDTSIPYQTAPPMDMSAWGKSKMPSAGTFALMMQVMGGINTAIGGYFAAKSQQYQAKSQAVNLGYQADMASINARQSEYAAESDIKSGQSKEFSTTMVAGQQKAAATVNMAARGLRGGTGTTADVAGSMDIVKDVNVYDINSNAVREASAARVQSTNFTNQSNLDRVSAANMGKTASTISPFAAGFSSLLSSATSVASQWNNSQRMKMYLANGGYMPGSMGGFN